MACDGRIMTSHAITSNNSIDDDDEVFSSNKSIDVSILTCVEMLWRVMAGL